MPSEPTGSDISGFGFCGSPHISSHIQRRHWRILAYSICFSFLSGSSYVRVYLVWPKCLWSNNGLVQIRVSRLSRRKRFCMNLSQCGISLSVIGIPFPRNQFFLGMLCGRGNSIHVIDRFVYSLIRNYEKFPWVLVKASPACPEINIQRPSLKQKNSRPNGSSKDSP